MNVMYFRYKKLQQQLEFLEVQEEYIKDEQRKLRLHHFVKIEMLRFKKLHLPLYYQQKM